MIWWMAGIAVWVGVAFYCWCLCRAAKISDQELERMVGLPDEREKAKTSSP